ncbi:MAG: YegP family protein [Gemmataceae bacterium]
MKKLLCSAVLFAGMAGLVSTATISTAPAQDKKDTTKKATADTRPGKVEVSEGKDGKFRFVVRDADGKYLAQSGAFEKKEDALKGIETLKEALAKATITGPAPKKPADKSDK